MKRTWRSLSIVIVFVICFVFIFSTSSGAAYINSKDLKILLITDDISILENPMFAEFNGLYDVIDYNKIQYSDINGYSAYAVPNELLESDERLGKCLQKDYLKRDSKVYIYGEFTINDYKRALGIEKFGVYANIYNKDGNITDDKAFLSFSEEQESTFTENIISSSGSQTGNYIIANVISENNNKTNLNFIKKILQDYSGSLITPMSVIVKSGYNFRSYYGDDYINMDYRLYKDTNETDPSYDYFALVTNLSPVNDIYNTYGIYARHTLPFSSDEMIDFDPGDITRAYSVSASVNLGSPPPGGSVGFSFEVGGGPTINATYSSADDYCNWDITKYWLLGSYLDGNLFKLGTSWASTGTYAGVNVKFRGCFSTVMGSVYSPWEYVEIRYDY